MGYYVWTGVPRNCGFSGSDDPGHYRSTLCSCRSEASVDCRALDCCRCFLRAATNCLVSVNAVLSDVFTVSACSISAAMPAVSDLPFASPLTLDCALVDCLELLMVFLILMVLGLELADGC